MSITTEIKAKEDSLAALMSRLLKEPLDPVNKSIDELKNTSLDIQDRLNEIQESVEANAQISEKSERSLKRAINSIIEDALPEQIEKIKIHLSAETEKSNTKALINLEEQTNIYKAHLNNVYDTLNQAFTQNTSRQIDLAQSIETLNLLIQQSATETNSNSELIHKLSAQSAASAKSLSVDLQETRFFLNNTLIEQQNRFESAQKILIEKFGDSADGQAVLRNTVQDIVTHQEESAQVLMRVNEISTEVQANLQTLHQTEQAFASAVERHQVALTQQLANQNGALVTQIAIGQAKLKRLGVTVSVFFASMLGYVGFDLWSKFH